MALANALQIVCTRWRRRSWKRMTSGKPRPCSRASCTTAITSMEAPWFCRGVTWQLPCPIDREITRPPTVDVVGARRRGNVPIAARFDHGIAHGITREGGMQSGVCEKFGVGAGNQGFAGRAFGVAVKRRFGYKCAVPACPPLLPIQKTPPRHAAAGRGGSACWPGWGFVVLLLVLFYRPIILHGRQIRRAQGRRVAALEDRL